MDSVALGERPRPLIFRRRNYFFISVYAFALSYFGTALGTIGTPQLIVRIVPDALQGTATGVVRYVGLLVAIIVQALAGSLSDRAQTRFGKRKPFILVGTLADLVFLVVLFFAGLIAGDFLWLLFATIGLQFTSNIAQGGYQGFISDLVPSARRGAASGAKSIAEMGAYLLAAFVATIQLGRGEWLQAFVVVGAVLVVGLALTWFGVDERRVFARPASEDRSGDSGWRGLLTLDRRRDASFMWWIVSRLLMATGVSVLTTYSFLYAKNFVHASDPNAVVRGLLVVTVAMILITSQPVGLIADRVGYKRLTILAGVLNALGIFLSTFANGKPVFTLGGFEVLDVLLLVSPVGIGQGLFLTANWALGIQLAPRAASGKYLGLSNLASAGSGVLAGLLGPIIDLAGFPPLLLMASLSVVFGTALVVWKVKVNE